MNATVAPRRRTGTLAILLWLAFLLLCGVIIARSQFTADLSAFLPRSPTPAQQLLLDQLRDGMASRVILVGIEGADAPTRARLSKQVAQRLRTDTAFMVVNNGEPVSIERDREYLFKNRYLLSSAVTPTRFEVDGLHTALSESIELLASPAGMIVRTLLPRDPTGEMMQLIEQLDSGTRPQSIDGAWASRDGARAMLLIQTRAAGSDTDAQQRAMNGIRVAFDAADGTAAAARLVMTGPGVFSVTSRETIQREVNRLSIISVLIIATLLLLVYRSVPALALGFLPVISGALAGIVAVSLGFGVVHGITLGFGTALIGEAVDYSIYLFVQSSQGEADRRQWITRYWPTIRLGVLTSIFGFASLLLSGFPGLAQLGLYSIAGLVTAAVATRFVLPHMLPASFRIHDVTAIGSMLSRLLRRAALLRWPAIIVLLTACAVLVQHRDHLWNESISSLSPVSSVDVDQDTRLRADMGAPDVRYLVVVTGADREAALQSSEKVSSVLQALVDQGDLAAFQSPSHYLPSMETQRARQMSLPAPDVLKVRLSQAVQGLPVRAPVFAPFLADVAQARTQPLLHITDLDNTAMAMAVNTLLVQQKHQWSALLPLTARKDIDINAERIRAALDAARLPNVMFVDMKAESNLMYTGYLHEAIVLSLGGLVAIIGLLLFTLRSVTIVTRIILPLVAAVVTVAAGLTITGHQMTILHLVGLLLTVAVGSNYALFFEGPGQAVQGEAATGAVNASNVPRTLASMLIANLTTVAGFGVLAFSNVSILQAMGGTVAPGVILALVYSAIFARTNRA